MPLSKTIHIVQPSLKDSNKNLIINNENLEFINTIVNNSKSIDGYKVENEILYQKDKIFPFFRKVSPYFCNLSDLDKKDYEYLFERMFKFVEDSFYQMPKIKTRDANTNRKCIVMYGFNKIESLIYNIVFKIQNSQYKDTLDFLSEFLIRLTMCHEFFDGNKRTSLLTFKKLLKSMGFYIKWSSIEETYVKHWEDFMKKISSEISEYEKKQIVIDNILKNVWLAF